jgi:citrate synthase
MSTAPTVDARQRGLEGVVIGASRVSLVQGLEGRLLYQGYDIADVVRALGYEDVVQLLAQGEIPGADARREFAIELARHRILPPEVEAVVDALPASTSPMDALRTGISALAGVPGSTGYPPALEHGIELVAKAPTILARFDRRRRGLSPIPPSTAPGHVANYLRMVTGEEPSPVVAGALESYFDLVADHGMNASTFALRVVLSTNADFLSGVVAAIGALKGPLHGGAPQHVLDMLDEIGPAEGAGAWIRDALARKVRLMGFGHRAYKVEDPRAVLLRRIAGAVATPERFRQAVAVESAALAELRKARPDQPLNTNVEFYAAIVLEATGLPRDLFPPTFALARTAGWTAHALEQAATNRLMRPDVVYVGPAPRPLPAGVGERPYGPPRADAGAPPRP